MNHCVRTTLSDVIAMRSCILPAHATSVAHQLIGAALAAIVAMLVFALPAAQAGTISMIWRGDAGDNWSRSWVDFNGDGRSDFCVFVGGNAETLQCYASTGNGFNATPQSFSTGHMMRGDSENVWLQWVDVNGDGLTDLCKRDQGDSSVANVNCRIAPAFTSTYSLALPLLRRQWDMSMRPWQLIGGADGLGEYRDIFSADVNGDGRADICYLHGSWSDGYGATAEMRCSLFTGSGFTASNQWAFGGVAVGVIDRTWPRAFVDFDGNGFPDFCRVLNNDTEAKTIRCLMNSANGFTSENTLPALSIPHREGSEFVDFNGDGKVDFCRVIGPAGWSNPVACRLSNGLSWDPGERQSVGLSAGDSNMRWWVDINADGFADYCRAVGSSLRCNLGRGDGEPVSLNSANVYAFAYTDVVVNDVDFGNGDGGRTFCDAEGHGVSTLCRISSQVVPTGETTCDGAEPPNCNIPVTVLEHTLKAGVSLEAQAQAAVLTALDGGVGAETRITYLPMTDPLVYTRSGTGAYPRAIIVQSTQPLVHETRAWSSGEVSTSLTGTARYFYRDLRHDTWAGSRGFRERWMFTEGTNTMEHTVFFQGLGPTVDPTSRENDPLEIGVVRLRERYAVDGSLQPSPGTTPSESQRQLYLKSIISKSTPRVPTSSCGASNGFRPLEYTTSTLSDTTPANLRYRYVGSSATTRCDLNGTQLPSVEVVTQQDNYGNVLGLTETTTHNGLTWSKATTNVFDSNEKWKRLGRLKTATVVSTAPSVSTQLAQHARSAGSSPNAAATSSPVPAVPQPIRPELLAPILQLLLED